MQKLLTKLQDAHPQLRFQPGPAFYWSPETSEIFYKSATNCKHSKGSQTRVQFGSSSSTEVERTQDVREHRSAEIEPKCAECASRDEWALLHEVSHALLGHQTYHTDVELLQLEVAAWARAEQLAADFDIHIEADHIQDCLDTYRDWLHGRSICPTCTTRSLQQSDHHYRCHNCHTSWRVSASRFCRPYRAVKNIAQPVTIFAAEAPL